MIAIKCVGCNNRYTCSEHPKTCGVVPPSIPDSRGRRYCLVCGSMLPDDTVINCLECNIKLRYGDDDQ